MLVSLGNDAISAPIPCAVLQAGDFARFSQYSGGVFT